MTKFTKEQLIEQARENVKALKLAAVQSAFKEHRQQIELDLQLAEYALAVLTDGMEKEPVAYIDPFTFKNFATYRAGETDNKRMGREWVWANPDAGLIPLYAAPQLPQPAVPDELAGKSFEYIANKFQVSMSEAQWILVGWNACRAAMLQGAEPVSQPYKLRDGWVAVPVEPTEKMVIEGFESVPHPLFQPADWDKYQTMSGCEKAAHRAKLCWAAMIKAAPKP